MDKSDFDGITLAKAAGSIKHLLDKLTGPKGDLWWRNLNHFLHQQDSWFDNPFKLTAEEQIERLRAEYAETFVQLGCREPSRSDIRHLLRTAPEWPEGPDGYRSFRIRFGEGQEGVAQTCRAHVTAIRRVHGTLWQSDNLPYGNPEFHGEPGNRLRLLAGNDSHTPTIEWIIIPDLQDGRDRESVTSARSRLSLADEGLVLAWLIPERVLQISFNWPGWHCGGYELHVPGRGMWAHTISVDMVSAYDFPFLEGKPLRNDDRKFSVPFAKSA